MDASKKKVTVGILAVSDMFAQCCISLIAPFYPLEAAKKGASDTMIGLIFGCSEFVIFLMSPVFGSMMSHVNPRFLYTAGLFVYGCCDVMFGFLNQSPSGVPFISICFAVRIVEATGTSALMTACYVIAGNVSPDKISTVYSVIQSAGGLGFIIGPAFGGFLYQYGGYGFPFWVLGSCVFVCGFVAMVLLPRQELVPNTSSRTTFSLFRSPRVSYGALVVVSNMMGMCVYAPTYAQELTKFGVSPGTTGFIMLLPALSYALTAPLWGVLLDRNQVKPLPLVVVGLAGTITVLMFFGPAPFLYFVPRKLWISTLCCGVLGLFGAVSSVGAIRYIIAGAGDLGFENEEEAQGLVAGLIQSTNCLGSFVGPLLGGLLTDHFGFGWSLTIVSFYCIIPFLLGCGGLCKKEKRNVQKKIDVRTPLLDSYDTKEESTGV